MKKRQLLTAAVLTVMMVVFTGCSLQKTPEASAPQETETVADAGVSAESEEKTVTGVVEEVKDFMFIIVQEDDTAYAFPIEDGKPEGIEEIQAGDTVVVTYTGEISEVDPFKGEVISVEKVE